MAVNHPINGFWLLKESETPGQLIKVHISKTTLQVIDEEKYEQHIDNWTEDDIKELLDEGHRFFDEEGE